LIKIINQTVLIRINSESQRPEHKSGIQQTFIEQYSPV